MLRSITTAVLLAATTLSAGCAAEATSDDDAASTEDAVRRNLKATLTEKTVADTIGQCKLDASYFQVVVPGKPAASKAISEALAFDKSKITDAADCQAFSTVYESTQRENHNGRGLLSIVRFKQSIFASAPQLMMDFDAVTFDLETGAIIPLSSALTQAGIDKIRAACVASLEPSVGPADTAAACDRAVRDGNVDGAAHQASWGVEAAGLRLYVRNLAPEVFLLGVEGVLVPWAEIRSDITHAKMKPLAR